MLEFKVLGRLQVLVDGEEVPVTDPVDRALLFGLLVNANREVDLARILPNLDPSLMGESGERLTRLVDGLPGTTRLTVSAREALLEVDEDLIDYHQAKALYAKAMRQPPERREELLGEAYALWPATFPRNAATSPEIDRLQLRVARAWEQAAREIGKAVELRSSEWHAIARHDLDDPSWFRDKSLSRRMPPDEPVDEEPPSVGTGGILVATDTMAVSMYLSDEAASGAVEAAVDATLARAGLAVIDRDDPVLGSWFRKVRASELGAVAAHAADSRLVLAQDAQVASTLLENLGPVLTALQPLKEAVVRMGAVLIVKLDDKVMVHQLTATQQLQLDHQPELAMAPREILTALRLNSATRDITRP